MSPLPALSPFRSWCYSWASNDSLSKHQLLASWPAATLRAKSVVSNSATLWTAAHQAPLSLGFFRQECWSGLLCPPPGDIPNPGMEPASLMSPSWQVGSLPPAPPGKPSCHISHGRNPTWTSFPKLSIQKKPTNTQINREPFPHGLYSRVHLSLGSAQTFHLTDKENEAQRVLTDTAN